MRHCRLLPLLRLGLFHEWIVHKRDWENSRKASALIFGKLYSATRKTLNRVFYESKSTYPCPRCSYCIRFSKSGFEWICQLKKVGFPWTDPQKSGPYPCHPHWLDHPPEKVHQTHRVSVPEYQLLVISSWIPNFSVKSRVIHWSTPQCMVPSGKLTELWKITIFFMGKSTIHGHFQ